LESLPVVFSQTDFEQCPPGSAVKVLLFNIFIYLLEW